MSNSLFPTFEPYWNRLRRKLSLWLGNLSLRYSQTSPYFKVALMANIVGIIGLLYFLAKLIFPGLFYSEEEIAQAAPFLSFFGGIFALFLLFCLSASIALLLAVASSSNYHKLAALASIAIGAVISSFVILGVFYN